MLISELKQLFKITKELDRKVIVIFISVALLQTISWYYTSRRFFRLNIFPSFETNPDVFLYEYLFWFLGDFFTYFILAIPIIKFVLKEELSDYGLKTGDAKAGLIFSLLFLTVMIPLIWIASSMPDFTSKYPHLLTARTNWEQFFIYEAGMLFYMFGWEFIWRGFMLFGLKEKFGFYSIFIQMVPFVILHNGKPISETIGAVFGGLALGVLAYRTNSIYYCILTHVGVMNLIDLFCTLRFRADDYGIGLNSFLNVFSKLF